MRAGDEPRDVVKSIVSCTCDDADGRGDRSEAFIDDRYHGDVRLDRRER
jgi:hypothetical protein